MHTPTRRQADVSILMGTALSQPAKAAAREPAEAPATSRTLQRGGAEWPRRQGRMTAALASVLISIGLLGSVVIGLTSMANTPELTALQKAGTSCDARPLTACPHVGG